MVSNNFEVAAADRIWPIIGRPQKSRMFLSGIRFDPPRAGMIAKRGGIGHHSWQVSC
jgi:hypothetical protein